MSYTCLPSIAIAGDVPHKRKPLSHEACGADNNPPIPNKRQKADDSFQEAQSAARDLFWNTLSKVSITPQSLQEFDRRNAAHGFEHLDPPSRKRSFVDTSHLSATSLTNLKRFARRGGPSLVDLINCPKTSPTFFTTINSLGPSSQGQKWLNKSGNPDHISTTNQTLLSPPYDRNFERRLFDHGIHMPSEDFEPENLQELQKRLRRPRPSLSHSQLSDREIKEFRKATREAQNKNDVMLDSLPTILGKNQRDYYSARNVLFRNMDDIDPAAFKKPKPDIYWGARPAQIERRVRQDLSHQIVPSTRDSYPAAPNFFLEAQGPKNSSALTTRRACYDGALGARAMQALQSYGQAELIYDNHAYTFSFTYGGGMLTMYSHHLSEPSHPGKLAEYHMNPVGAWCLTASNQAFRDGVGAFRNARDLAKEQRDTLIDQANAVARTQLEDTQSLDGSDDLDTPAIL